MGCDVLLSEMREIPPDVREILGASDIRYESGGHTDRIFDSERIVLGSGFPPYADIMKKIADRGVTPLGEIDFVMPHIQGRVIGVTGSNGKTTTASLLGHLLRSSGHNAVVAGNIGRPLADVAGEGFDFVVVELSSFQLHWVSHAKLAGAIVTNLAPDHIDWHGSYDKYTAAKSRILNMAGEGGFSIVQNRDTEILKAHGGGVFTLDWTENGGERGVTLNSDERVVKMGGRELFRFEDVKLLGFHNMENAAMAMAALKLLGCDEASARSALSTFTPPPHRCSLVLISNGVRYVDDSKGTNIAATITAMRSIDGRKIVILGGRGKGENYAELVQPLKDCAKSAILIGEAASEMADVLKNGDYLNYYEAGEMESAVRTAVSLAEPGDVVLLSPACTSWDAYRNYNERGDHFASLVLKCTQETESAGR
jgi:UDP-N-acetylmuramoylalanine--D-glutamate ligase